MTRAVLVAAAVLAAGCSDGDNPPPPPQQPVVLADAGAVDGITSIGAHDPASGMHVDEGGGGRDTKRSKPRGARTIDIMLRSTPPGAGVYVGAEYMGETPTLWSGDPPGESVDFVFVLPGHATARYKFIPITSGLVHGRLEPIAVTPSDGGLEPQIAPKLAPDAAVAPPPTVLTPVDAAAAPVIELDAAGPRGPNP